MVLRSNEFAGSLTQPQREAVAMLFLRLHGQGHALNEMFWGLWLLPFGLLIARSHFIPRLLGIWLLLDGFAWVGLSIVALLGRQATTISRLKWRSRPCSQRWGNAMANHYRYPRTGDRATCYASLFAWVT